MWSCRRTTSSPFDTGDRRDGGSAASAAPEEHRTKMEKELINMKCHSQRILARDIYIDNDTRATGNNNNDLIIGPSGAGKTRGYVIPNILQAEGSLVVTDTKGNLCRQFRPYLESRGYQVIELNFARVDGNTWGYNPLSSIRYDQERGEYSQQDIIALSAIIAPVLTRDDPFWDQSAQIYLQALVGYVLECLPEEERSLNSVCRLSGLIGSITLDQMFRELGELKPDCFAVSRYRSMLTTRSASRTDACIRAFLDRHLLPLSYSGVSRMFSNRQQVSFEGIGTRKTAVFLTVSDTDRSNDQLVNLFYAQAFQRLVALADRCPDARLPVPVRFILDDFATNTVIPDFDNLISVIRSREISVSLVIQSLSQLESIYGRTKSQTIVNNCDNWLYLGGLDLQTAQEMSTRLNRTIQSVLNMSHDDAVVLTRGQAPRRCGKFVPEDHPFWKAAMARLAAAGKTGERSLPYERAV